MLIHERALGDTLTPLQVQLLDVNGTPLNLTGKTVRFSMNNANGQVIVSDSAATITDAVNGHVSYDFLATEVDVGSTVDAPDRGYFHVYNTYPGEPDTFPPDGIDIVIHDPARDRTPVPSIDIIGMANAPKRTRTEEGTVEERTIDELIKADQYQKTLEASEHVPWGIRLASIRPRGPVPRGNGY